MYYVDNEDELNDFFLDPNRRIPSAHLNSVCKIGKKEACRYISRIVVDGSPYVCMKKSPARGTIDMWARTKNFSAKSDNCEGLGLEYDKK